MYPPGTLLSDRYRVLRLLGEGAMGSVYEAEHTVLRRRVALKALHPRFARVDEAVGRFVREAQAAASIGHPHIVDVLDFGVFETVPFLVMELLRGETLAERMAHEALDVATACTLTAQVLSALSSAHAMGIVHRDLKPENVMIVGDGPGVRGKLLDFGVSKFLQRDPRDDTRSTAEGVLMGTPSYMSPEQWVGAPDIDHRADLYAVGVMLFEMLSGELPFEAPTQVEMYRIVALGVERPPRLDALNASIPAPLASAVARALARDPHERFESAAEFFDAVAAYATEVPAIDRAAPRSRPISLVPAPPELTPARISNTPTLAPASATDATRAAPHTAPQQRLGLRIAVVVAALLGLGGGFFALGRASGPDAQVVATPVVRADARVATAPAPAAASPVVPEVPLPVAPEAPVPVAAPPTPAAEPSPPSAPPVAEAPSGPAPRPHRAASVAPHRPRRTRGGAELLREF